MNQRVFDSSGSEQLLAAELGRGGEGSAHGLLARPDLAVKIYNPEKLASHGPALRRKIEAQIGLWPALEKLPVAWPRLSVFDQKGSWIGYAMKRGAGVPLRKLAHPGLGHKYFPQLTRRFTTQALLQLVSCVDSLHRANIHLGDINLNNFLCDPATGQVTLIDCDSFQVATPLGEVFPSPVGSPDTTPPEHLGLDFARIQRTASSDAFSLAILIFQCLMLGRHPYDSIGGCNPVDNLRQGHFPYGEGGSRPGSQGAIPCGPWYLLWSHLSGSLKSAFIRNFREGALDPLARPGVDDWRLLLKQYNHAMEKGWLTDELRPAAAKPRGQRTGSRPSA
jgi:DNA-binding helix-hairpin-helix protein with protein kinase domain